MEVNTDVLESQKKVNQKQVETGTKISKSFNSPTFVFAMLWPSWLFAAKGAGCSEILVCVEDAKEGVEEVIKSTMSKHDQWLDKNAWGLALQEWLSLTNTETGLLLLQGPRDTLQRVLKWVEKFPNALSRLQILAFATNVLSEDRSTGKRRKLSHRTFIQPCASIAHQCVGGVLNHSWTLESNAPDLLEMRHLLTRQSLVQATVTDYLSHVKDGFPVPAPDEQAMEKFCRVAWKKRVWKVVAKSVFSRTGWVKRDLTMDELMDVYDVSVEDRRKMNEVVFKCGLAACPSEFTQQLPVRVLLRCLEVLLTPRNEMVVKDAVEDKWGDQPVCETHHLENVLKEREWERMSLMVSAGQGVTDEAKQQTKNDDASAQVVHWNERIFRGLNRIYIPEQHARILDVLREGQLRRYWSYKYGVIRSFRKFMEREHGDNWLSLVRSVQRNKAIAKEGAQETEVVNDYRVGMDAIERAVNASFWEWDDGSTIFFWRWPEEHRQEMRDGMKVWCRRQLLPSFWKNQRWPNNDVQREQL